MRQPFRLPVTGSRTWNDSAIIEHARPGPVGDDHAVLLQCGHCPPDRVAGNPELGDQRGLRRYR